MRIKYQGSCGNTTAKTTHKRQSKKCTAGLKDCINSTKRAVCGSDNTTYSSFCYFRVARCLARQNGSSLTILHKGECGRPKTQHCPLESQCDNLNDPICGSNGKTYKNTCLFLIAKCKARSRNNALFLKKKGRKETKQRFFSNRTSKYMIWLTHGTNPFSQQHTGGKQHRIRHSLARLISRQKSIEWGEISNESWKRFDQIYLKLRTISSFLFSNSEFLWAIFRSEILKNIM